MEKRRRCKTSKLASTKLMRLQKRLLETELYVDNSTMDGINNQMLSTLTIGGERCIEVSCGGNSAILYLSKLSFGSKNECIEHRGEWLTPNQFQYKSGKGSAKNWKRSIHHKSMSLKTLIDKGIVNIKNEVRKPLKSTVEVVKKHPDNLGHGKIQNSIVEGDHINSFTECTLKSMRRDEKSKRKRYPSKRLTKSGTSGMADVDPEATSRVVDCKQCTTHTCNCVDVVKNDQTSNRKNYDVEVKFESAKIKVEALEAVEHEHGVSGVDKQKEELMTLLCLKKQTKPPDIKEVNEKQGHMNIKSNISIDQKIKACPTKVFKDTETKHEPLKQSVTMVMESHAMYEAVTPPPTPPGETHLSPVPPFNVSPILYTYLPVASATTASESRDNTKSSCVGEYKPIHNYFAQSNDEQNTVTTDYTRNVHSNNGAIRSNVKVDTIQLCKDNRASVKVEAKDYECISENKHPDFRIINVKAPSNPLNNEGIINSKCVEAERPIIKSRHSNPYIQRTSFNTTSASLDTSTTDRIKSNLKRSIDQTLKRKDETSLCSESAEIRNKAYCVDNKNYGVHFGGQRAFIKTSVDHMSKSYVIQNTLTLDQRHSPTNERSSVTGKTSGQNKEQLFRCPTVTGIPLTLLSNRLEQSLHHEKYSMAGAFMSEHNAKGYVFQVPSKRETSLLDNTYTLRTLGASENLPLQAQTQDTKMFNFKLQRIPVPNLTSIDKYASQRELQTVYSQTQVSDFDVPLDLSVNKDKTVFAGLENVTCK